MALPQLHRGFVPARAIAHALQELARTAAYFSEECTCVRWSRPFGELGTSWGAVTRFAQSVPRHAVLRASMVDRNPSKLPLSLPLKITQNETFGRSIGPYEVCQEPATKRIMAHSGTWWHTNVGLQSPVLRFESGRRLKEVGIISNDEHLRTDSPSSVSGTTPRALAWLTEATPCIGATASAARI